MDKAAEAICIINALLLRLPLSRRSNFVPIVVGGGQPGWLQYQLKTWAPAITCFRDAANRRDGWVPREYCLAVGTLLKYRNLHVPTLAPKRAKRGHNQKRPGKVPCI